LYHKTNCAIINTGATESTAILWHKEGPSWGAVRARGAILQRCFHLLLLIVLAIAAIYEALQ